MKEQYIDQYGIDSLPHLRNASNHKVDYFVTINKSLIKDRDELENKFNIKIRTPKEMLELKSGECFEKDNM
jgi:hypothetical protein